MKRLKKFHFIIIFMSSNRHVIIFCKYDDVNNCKYSNNEKPYSIVCSFDQIITHSFTLPSLRNYSKEIKRSFSVNKYILISQYNDFKTKIITNQHKSISYIDDNIKKRIMNIILSMESAHFIR